MNAGPGTRARASVQHRVVAIAAVAFLAVAGIIGFSGSIVLDLRNAVDHQRTVLVPAMRLVSDYHIAVLEQQRGERGYVITGDPAFVASYEESAADVARTHDALVRRLRFDPQGQRLLAAADAAFGAWSTEAADPAMAAVSRGEMAEAAATVATLGRPRFAVVQERLRALDAHVGAHLDDSERQVAADETRLLQMLFTAGLAALVVLALVLAALDRWVIDPVQRLSAAVRVVAAGDLRESVTVVGPREVVELADDVEAMRLRIVAELEEMRRANEALEQQAPLVVGLRDVLLPGVEAETNLDIDSLFLPAEGVLAGDWFDVWSLDDGRVALVMVDISGHGAEAGLFALRLKDLLLAAVAIFPQPGAALGWVADRLGDTGERFATIFLAVIDPARGRMAYANAGHPAVLVASAESITTLLPTGPLLGPLRATWESRTADLHEGTVLVVHTDGLTEARSGDGEEFGPGRLLEVVTRLRGLPPGDVVAGCREELEGFAAGRFQDDVTLVAVATRPPR